MVAHLANQKHRCATDGTCVYRGPNGTKCVVGAMISDETAALINKVGQLKSTAIGSGEVWALAKAELALEDLEESKAKSFYVEMQAVHDKSCHLGDVLIGLGRIATNYKLDPALVSTITSWSR